MARRALVLGSVVVLVLSGIGVYRIGVESQSDDPPPRSPQAPESLSPLKNVHRSPIARSIVHDQSARASVEKVVSSRSGVSDSYDELASMATAGNSDAAYALFLDIQRCSYSASVLNALESIAASASDEASASATERAVERAEMDRQFCAGMTPQMAESGFDWLAMAARSGNVDAKSQFFVHALARFSDPTELIARSRELDALKEESVRHLMDAAAAGNQQSIGVLAEQYEQGMLVPRGPARAYVFARVLELAGARTAHLQIDRLRPELDPAVLSDAERQATEFFRHCCGGGG